MRFRTTAVLVAALGWFGAMAQTIDLEQLKDSLSNDLMEESFIVYHNKDIYSFDISGTAVKARLDTEKEIFQNSEDEFVYYDYSDSYSKIFGVSSPHFHSVKQYESGGIFHNDFFVNSFYYKSKRDGLFILEYSKIYSDYKFLGALPFLHGYPTLKSTIVLEIPSDIDIEIREMNFEGYQIERNEEELKKSKKITYTLSKIEYQEECYYCPSARHYQPHLVLIYKTIEKGGEKRELLPDVSNLYGWYRTLILEMEDNPAEISELVERFKYLPSGEQQLKAVFDWVKTNIRYIAFESGMAGFKPDECQVVYQNRYGDCKGMANLYKNVMLELGYDARLAWLGTRKEVPYDYSIPSLIVDNHMIAAVKVNDQFIFIDPTETYGNHLEYAFRIQGRPVLIEDGDEFILTEVPESENNSDLIKRSFRYSFDPLEKLTSMKGEIIMKGEPKKSVIANYEMILAQERTTALGRYLQPYESGSFFLIKADGIENNADSVHFIYTFTTASGIINVGGEYYLDVDPSSDLEFLKFQEKRKASYYFGERYNRETFIELEIPTSYEITHKPESFSFSTDQFQVSVDLQEKENKLFVEKVVKIYNGEVRNDEIDVFNEALVRLRDYYEDRVILSQK